MLLDGSRRRTPGGVFFRLVREQTTPAERSRIWPWTKQAKPRRSWATKRWTVVREWANS
jgi:hypothetical protein